MAEEEDPFGAFGGSDSDDSDNDEAAEVSEQTKKAQALLQAANASNNQPRDDGNPSIAKPESHSALGTGTSLKEDSVDLSSLEACTVESFADPLYLSPDVRLVSSLPFGGGRGYVALKTLKPGTLVMVEEAIMTWPDEQLGKALTLSSVHRLLHHPNASKVVQCLEDFHPTKEVVDADVESDSPDQVDSMLESLEKKHKGDAELDQLVQDAQTLRITNCDSSALSSKDILRLFLALRYNGLESGLYCHVAMINHKCQPNCVKFLPNSKESDLPENCSEVRTTCLVKAGECLTISYMPKIASHSSRRRHLWDQHRFDIGVKLESNLQKMELVNGGLPSSSREFVDDDSVTSRVERSIAELDALYHSTKSALPSLEAVEHAKALEVSCLELYLEARRQLQNDNHLLFIPAYVLHLDACDLVLSEDARKTILSHTQRCKLLGRTVSTALHLLELQQAYWGKDHFDVARTNQDLSQSIQELLSKSPDHLLQLAEKQSDLKTFRDWSAFEYKCQKDYERIKDLYPRDASKYIAKKT